MTNVETKLTTTVANIRAIEGTTGEATRFELRSVLFELADLVEAERDIDDVRSVAQVDMLKERALIDWHARAARVHVGLGDVAKAREHATAATHKARELIT